MILGSRQWLQAVEHGWRQRREQGDPITCEGYVRDRLWRAVLAVLRRGPEQDYIRDSRGNLIPNLDGGHWPPGGGGFEPRLPVPEWFIKWELVWRALFEIKVADRAAFLAIIAAVNGRPNRDDAGRAKAWLAMLLLESSPAASLPAPLPVAQETR